MAGEQGPGQVIPVTERRYYSLIDKVYDLRNCSHGFRQGFSTRSAIAMVEEYRKRGFRWVVDVDFKSYFDTLDHEVLMAKVKERVTDGSVLSLIRSWLTAGVMSDGNLTYQTTGTPQGGVISPLLANGYLHSLDLALTRWGYKVVRYADDLVVCCQTQNKAKTALGLLKQLAEGELRLTLHLEKTRITRFYSGFDFLGFTFKRQHRVARRRALDKFKDKVRELTPRQTHYTVWEVIAQLNPMIRGWGNYFKMGHMKGRLEAWTSGFRCGSGPWC